MNILAIAGGVTSVVLLTGLIVVETQNTHLARRLQEQTTLAALSAANTETCKAEIVRQNAALKAQSDADAAKIADITRAYTSASAARTAAERSVGAFLSVPPAGQTLLERYESVDARVMEDLK